MLLQGLLKTDWNFGQQKRNYSPGGMKPYSFEIILFGILIQVVLPMLNEFQRYFLGIEYSRAIVLHDVVSQLKSGPFLLNFQLREQP